ncbi:MAG: hypothetical protein K0Q60_4004 [Microvirga sp.]|nr:hypothetical protein [Microvirga sp.]
MKPNASGGATSFSRSLRSGNGEIRACRISRVPYLTIRAKVTAAGGSAKRHQRDGVSGDRPDFSCGAAMRYHDSEPGSGLAGFASMTRRPSSLLKFSGPLS